MAKATAVHTAPSVTLELSGEEAQALLAIFWSTGGNPHGARGHIDRIMKALATAYCPSHRSDDVMEAASKACLVTGSVYLDKDGNK